MENREISERYPVFIRDIDELRRSARDDVVLMKGTTHEVCGSVYGDTKVDAYFDIEPDDPEHASALLVQGVPAVVCECLDERVYEEPIRLTELTRGTVQLIEELFSAEHPGFFIKGAPLLVS